MNGHILLSLDEFHFSKFVFGCFSQDGKEFLITPLIKNSQDVEIYDAITVTPPVLVFPWDPSKKANYHYHLEVGVLSGYLLRCTSSGGFDKKEFRPVETQGRIGLWQPFAAQKR